MYNFHIEFIKYVLGVKLMCTFFLAYFIDHNLCFPLEFKQPHMARQLATGCNFDFELHQPTKCVFTILSEPLSAAWSRNLPINFFITLGPFPPTQVMLPTTIFLHFLTFLHYSSILLFVGDIKTTQKTCNVFGGWVVESNLFFSKRLVF
jgi:hypothetical protein